MSADFERKRSLVLSGSIGLLVLSCLSILFAITHLGRYGGAHHWYLVIGSWDYLGKYTGDGLWGCISGVIGAILGIAAGKSSDFSAFRSLYAAHSVFTGLNIAISFCALCATALGCTAYWLHDFNYHFDDGIYIAIYMIEGLFLLMVFFASCTAPCRIGCWCSLESTIQPMPVSQPNHMVYNPHYGQQMQYQNNAFNQYYPHQPQMPLQQMPAQHMPAQQMPVQHMPAQEMPINMTAPAVTATLVNDPPAYPTGSTEEATETEQKTITPENEQNSENRPIELKAGSEPNVTVPVEDTSSETTMEAKF